MKRKQLQPYITDYLHKVGRRKGLPIAGNFELTARCNFDCPMCYVHRKQDDAASISKELTTEQWISLARDARDAGMVFALLTGGEPFIRKDFFEIYGAMKEMGILVSLNSNGSMLTGEVRRKLLEDPPVRINISLYGGCSDTYVNMCGQPAFDSVVNNIRELKEAGVNVSLNLSITPYNRQDIRLIYEIAQELQVGVRAAGYMYPQIRVNGEQFGKGNRLNPEEAAVCSVEWDLLRLEKEEFNVRAENLHQMIAVEPPECALETDAGVRCRAGSTTFWITWDGHMLPCGMMPSPTVYPLKTGFSNAWAELRQKTREIRSPKECLSCPKRDICPTCAAVCVTETGSYEGVPKYLCKMTDATIERTWAAYLEKRGKNNGN